MKVSWMKSLRFTRETQFQPLEHAAAVGWLTRGRQRKKSRTPRGEISWNQVEIVRNQSRFPWNQSRFPWNQARKLAQPSSPTHFYNIWRHFEGNHGDIKEKSGDLVRQNCSLPTPRWLRRLQNKSHPKMTAQQVGPVTISQRVLTTQ